MSNKEWQVGPVLKEKAGSQGTLFRGGTKYSSPERFPRGYTPERLHAVADKVIKPSIKIYTDERGRQESRGTASLWASNRKVRGSGTMSDDNLYREDNSHVRNLVSNIARSTVPLEHLNSVQFSSNIPEAHMPDALGQYHRANEYDQAKIRIREGHEKEDTPIHEIGHHVSRTIEGNTHASYETSSLQGAEEGRADDYAQEHFRNEKGRPEVTGTYAGGRMDGKRNREFYESYHTQRGTQPLAPRMGGEGPESTLGPDGTRQGALLQKWHSDWDGGSYKSVKAEINPDALPRTKK